jgi:hypothetical protein
VSDRGPAIVGDALPDGGGFREACRASGCPLLFRYVSSGSGGCVRCRDRRRAAFGGGSCMLTWCYVRAVTL